MKYVVHDRLRTAPPEVSGPHCQKSPRPMLPQPPLLPPNFDRWLGRVPAVPPSPPPEALCQHPPPPPGLCHLLLWD